MDKQAYIFIGRSGCGKGTQANLLKDFLTKQGKTFFNLETGDKFREFVKGDSYSSQLANKIGKTGGLQPEFLATLMWASSMVDQVKGGEDFVLDGTPRKMTEAKILDSALRFYEFKKPIVVFVNVSRKWSEDRLLGRGRADDDTEEIEKRLNWFDTDVQPVIDWYKGEDSYNFLDINGEQTIEEVHQEIMDKIA
jgi:adenylate kinase